MPSARLPKISIGLPVHNGGGLLPRALDHLLAQDFKDFELIISDNGSTDNTQAICQEYMARDSRINYYNFSENMGMLHTFHRLAELARGEYYMLAFHNDYFAADYLSSCLEVLENDSSVALCYAGAHLIDKKGNSVSDVTDKFRMDQDSFVERYRQILTHLNLCNCFHGLMRSKYMRFLLPYDICAAGDVTFLSKLALKGKLIQIDRPLCFRALPTHMSFNNMRDRYKHFETLGWPYLPSKDLNPLPFFDMVWCLVEHICDLGYDDATKEKLIRLTYEILFKRYRQNIIAEIQNLVSELHGLNIRHIWKEKKYNKSVDKSLPNLGRFYLIKRLGEMDRLINYFSSNADLYYITGALCSNLGRIEEAKLRLDIALRMNPDHPHAAHLNNILRKKVAV